MARRPSRAPGLRALTIAASVCARPRSKLSSAPASSSPNAEFITGAVKNWTHANTIGRIIVKVGAGHDSAPDVVRDILLACASEHPRVLAVPGARALLVAFGDKALEFELRAYIGHVDDALLTRSDLNLAILRRFRAAGIEIR